MADPHPRQHSPLAAVQRRELQDLFREKGTAWRPDVDVPVVIDWILKELVPKMLPLARRAETCKDAESVVGDFLVAVAKGRILKSYDPARATDQENPTPKDLLWREFLRTLSRTAKKQRSKQHSREQTTPTDPAQDPLGFAVSREPGPAEAAELAELTPIIEAAIKALPGHYEIVVRLFYFENLSSPEIARVLVCNVTTVQQRLTRARQQLRLILDGRI